MSDFLADEYLYADNHRHGFALYRAIYCVSNGLKWHDHILFVAEFDSFLDSAAIYAEIVKAQICQ